MHEICVRESQGSPKAKRQDLTAFLFDLDSKFPGGKPAAKSVAVPKAAPRFG